jgi:hypothetical protein
MVKIQDERIEALTFSKQHFTTDNNTKMGFFRLSGIFQKIEELFQIVQLIREKTA